MWPEALLAVGTYRDLSAGCVGRNSDAVETIHGLCSDRGVDISESGEEKRDIADFGNDGARFDRGSEHEFAGLGTVRAEEAGYRKAEEAGYRKAEASRNEL